ncbi:MAG: class I SAM-dependent methyltransferase [Cytophagaceae bacterium]
MLDKTWVAVMNDRNINYYNNLGVNTLQQLAVVGGFNTCIDLDTVSKYINTNSSILELGAGYGRCIDYFIARSHKGKLIGVERSPVLFQYLIQKFDGTPVQLIEGDIKNLSLPVKVDVALWMWSGIIDFSKEEQEESFNKIYKLLNAEGKLIIDVPRIGFKTYAHHIDDQHLHVENEYGTLDCFIPNVKDIKEMAKSAGFRKVEVMDYDTSTGKARTVYLVFK